MRPRNWPLSNVYLCIHVPLCIKPQYSDHVWIIHDFTMPSQCDPTLLLAYKDPEDPSVESVVTIQFLSVETHLGNLCNSDCV